MLWIIDSLGVNIRRRKRYPYYRLRDMNYLHQLWSLIVTSFSVTYLYSSSYHIALFYIDYNTIEWLKWFLFSNFNIIWCITRVTVRKCQYVFRSIILVILSAPCFERNWCVGGWSRYICDLNASGQSVPLFLIPIYNIKFVNRPRKLKVLKINFHVFEFSMFFGKIRRLS